MTPDENIDKEISAAIEIRRILGCLDDDQARWSVIGFVVAAEKRRAVLKAAAVETIDEMG